MGKSIEGEWSEDKCGENEDDGAKSDDVMEVDTCCNDVLTSRDLSTWEGRVMRIVPFPTEMKLRMPKCPSDGLHRDDLDPARSDNSVTLGSDVGNDCVSSSWNWNDSLEEASYDQAAVMTWSDLNENLSVPWRSEVALPLLRDCDDCWDWSEYVCDESVRRTD
jgi:hypothetical protein